MLPQMWLFILVLEVTEDEETAKKLTTVSASRQLPWEEGWDVQEGLKSTEDESTKVNEGLDIEIKSVKGTERGTLPINRYLQRKYSHGRFDLPTKKKIGGKESFRTSVGG